MTQRAFQPAAAAVREPANCDRLPRRSESPTGYSLAGCSPAEPASASPVVHIIAQTPSRNAADI